MRRFPYPFSRFRPARSLLPALILLVAFGRPAAAQPETTVPIKFPQEITFQEEKAYVIPKIWICIQGEVNRGADR